MNQGQINRGSQLGEIIYNFCKKDEVKIIFEIGTWNGLGTTKCIYDAIIDSKKDDYYVLSLESNKQFHEQAIKNLPKLKNFDLLLGRIIEVDELFQINDMGESYYSVISPNMLKEWRDEDIQNYNKISNIFDKIPESIDLAILDGGEFSSFQEFKKIEDRTSYFILDDTNIMKNFKVSEYMRNNKNYEILFDVPSDRNGFLVSKKIF